MKHVQASISTRKDGENSFLQCGSPGKLPYNAVLTCEETL